MALKDLIAERTELGAAQAEHLTRLVSEWQLLADLGFADLLLLCPSRKRGKLVVAAQMRPYTAQTLYQDDQVGTVLDEREAPFAAQALAEGRIVREGDPVWRSGTPVRVEGIPVRHRGRVIAAVSQEQNLAAARTPSRLELTYLQAAGDLSQMIAEGSFPFPDYEPDPEAMPRVGDGLMRLSASGWVAYASPNAVSAYRRLGVAENVIDRAFRDFDPNPGPVLEAMLARRPAENEVERRGTVVFRRAVPLVVGGQVSGALVLLRDVTELRRRDRMIRLKDATIREIHHRVKNNLQTVASLLRLQGRRLSSPDAREALDESVRRIRAIALVHETLSLEHGDVVDFDQVAGQVVTMIREGLASPGVDVSLHGSWGLVSAAVATPMSVVLAELLQNSVDHAFGPDGGRIEVRLTRQEARLGLEVADDGRGLPEDFALDRAGLGLQIVRALVESELGGEVAVDGRAGTSIRLAIEVPRV